MPKEFDGYLNDVEIFSTGTWNGDKYTIEDLDSMVDAFSKVCFKPSLKIGHDKKQLLASGFPSLGRVYRLYRKGEKLIARFKEVPKIVARLIKKKAFNNISSEIIWDYKEGNNEFKRVLSGVALLGSEMPAVSNLKEIEALYTSDLEKEIIYNDSVNILTESGYSVNVYKKIFQDNHDTMYQISDKFSERPWADIDKITLPRSAHLIQGDPNKKSTWQLPVYEGAGGIDPETGLYRERGKININGVKAAFGALKGARGATLAAPPDVMGKLEKWLTEAGVGERGEQKDMSEEKIKELAKEIEEKEKLIEEKEKLFAELQKKVADGEAKIKEFSASEQKISNLTKQLEDASKNLESANTKIEVLRNYNRKAENEAWIKENMSEHKYNILPAERETVSFLLDSLTSINETTEKKYSFGEKKDISVVDAFKGLIEGRKLGNTLFKEFAKQDSPIKSDNPSEELHLKTLEYSRKHNINYIDASAAVLREDSDLKNRYAGCVN